MGIPGSQSSHGNTKDDNDKRHHVKQICCRRPPFAWQGSAVMNWTVLDPTRQSPRNKQTLDVMHGRGGSIYLESSDAGHAGI
jgi:hypothetical protein